MVEVFRPESPDISIRQNIIEKLGMLVATERKPKIERK